MKRILAIVAVLLTMPVSSLAQVREISLDEVVRLAIDHSQDIRMAVVDVEKANQARRSAIAAMAPKVTIEASFQYWDDSTRVQIVDPSALEGLSGLPSSEQVMTDLAPLMSLMDEQAQQTLGSLFSTLANLPPMLGDLTQPLEVQEQLTGSVTLQAVQPLTPLYSLAQAYRVSGFEIEAANLEKLAIRNNLTFEVSDLFFKLRSALAMVDLAQKGVEQVEAHLATAKKFCTAGLVGRDDVLRAETVLASVMDQLNQARTGVALVRAALSVKMGLAMDTALVPAGDFPDPPPQPPVTLSAAIERAITERPETRQLAVTVRMADAGHQAKIGQLIPTIAAVFRYTNFQGSRFQRENSAFIGAVLQWDFWNWGQSYFEAESARLSVDKVRLGLEKARELISLDVKKAWLELKQAESSIAAYGAAIKSAEENLRVVTRKYDNSTATSVEVLDAQGTLTQARGKYSVSLYSYYISYANLYRAMSAPIAFYDSKTVVVD